MKDLHTPAGRATCKHCLRAQRTCICRLVTPIRHATEVLILQHPMEVRQAKGTARLLHLCLPGSRIEVGEEFDATSLRAMLFDPWGNSARASQSGSVQPLLLYPSAIAGDRHAAECLPSPFHGNGRAQRLVILDGTWRKSRKMVHMNPMLATLPRLSLSAPPPSAYRIRKAHRPNQLSTLEAACHALSAIEQNAERFAPLLAAFTQFIDRHRKHAQAGGSDEAG